MNAAQRLAGEIVQPGDFVPSEAEFGHHQFGVGAKFGDVVLR
jgi:hypothetical protein